MDDPTQGKIAWHRNDSVSSGHDISGENIGYVLLFVGFYDQDSNSIFVADTDYLESDDTREIDGVYYPDWGEGEFTMEFEWEPLMFAVSDGVDSVVAALAPLILIQGMERRRMK